MNTGGAKAPAVHVFDGATRVVASVMPARLFGYVRRTLLLLVSLRRGSCLPER